MTFPSLIQSRRRGFAMPMVILVMGFLTATVLAAFARSEADIVTADNQGSQTKAFAFAEAGLAQFIAAGQVVPDTTTYSYTGGSAGVRAIRIRQAIAPNKKELWLIRSTGRMTGPSARVQARRTVAQFAEFVPGEIDVDAAWTSLSGLVKNGGAGTISGVDHAPPPKCSGGDVAGVSVPTTISGSPGYQQNGGTFVPEGNPPMKTNGTQAQMVDSVKVDWNAIVNQNAIKATVVIPGGTFPSTAWFTANPNAWPVIYLDVGATGTYTIPNSGRGTIISEGSVVINGSDTWDGIILAGRHVTSNGNNTVRGTAISGLNVKLGLSVPPNDIGNGNKTFAYQSCNILKALQGFNSLQPVQNAWMDNWSAW